MKNNFIDKIAPIIQREGLARGYKVISPVIAQAIIESKSGKSTLSAKYHNYFGLKCGSHWKGASVNLKTKEEYTPGVLTDIKANFRAYPDMVSGVKGYYDFISTPRYASLKTAETPRRYLELIKAAGYATSSSYVNTCMKVVQNYNLVQWDIDHPINTDLEHIAIKVINGEYGNGEERKARLRAEGFDPATVQKFVNELLK